MIVGLTQYLVLQLKTNVFRSLTFTMLQNYRYFNTSQNRETSTNFFQFKKLFGVMHITADGQGFNGM